MNYRDLIQRVVMKELLVLYQPPRHLETPQAAAVWQTAIIDGLALAKPTEEELCAVWAIFKQKWTKRVWPGVGELCEALQTNREKRSAKLPPPTPEATKPIDHSMTAREEGEFKACVADLRANPKNYMNPDALLAMADFFESPKYERVKRQAEIEMDRWERAQEEAETA